jgi:hypothetical protein
LTLFELLEPISKINDRKYNEHSNKELAKHNTTRTAHTAAKKQQNKRDAITKIRNPPREPRLLFGCLKQTTSEKVCFVPRKFEQVHSIELGENFREDDFKDLLGTAAGVDFSKMCDVLRWSD